MAQDRALKMLAAALEKEEFGRDYYKKAVDRATNTLGKEIFKMLMVEEGIHISRIKKLFEALEGGKWSSDWKSVKGANEDLKGMFQQRAEQFADKVKPETTDLEAIDLALDFEQGAIKFFEDHLSEAEDALEKEFIEAMILEERGHYAALADMKFYFTDPESWHAEMERPGVDGG